MLFETKINDFSKENHIVQVICLQNKMAKMLSQMRHLHLCLVLLTKQFVLSNTNLGYVKIESFVSWNAIIAL